MGLLRRSAGTAWYAWSSTESRRFARAIADPRAAQASALARVREQVDFRARGLDPQLAANPVVGWEGVRALADRVADGHLTAMARDPAVFVEPTGGSTGGDKLVPYNAALLAEFARATTPWVHDLMRRHPEVRRGSAYWAVSPPARPEAVTRGGVQLGASHDSEYFPPVVRRLIDAVLGMPRALSLVRDHDAHRYVTLRALLAMEDLAFVSVWSPSFLSVLAGSLDEHWERLLVDVERGGADPPGGLPPQLRDQLRGALPARPRRASRLRRSCGAAAPRDLARAWPRLAVVSCWTDAQAALALPAMRERVPGVHVQGKGLLATEGVTTIPIEGLAAPVAAVDSHVLEFLPVDEDGSATTLLARDATGGDEVRRPWQLDDGARYEVVLTTSGGLVRYRTYDVVEVVGHAPGTPTPLLRFTGRADLASDLAGEKLVPAAVAGDLAAATAAVGADPSGWYMLVPDGDHVPPRYVLAHDARLEPARARRLADELEQRLRAQHHYDLCRSLGQLAAVEPLGLSDPLQAWTAACADLGQRTGTLKPTALDPRTTLLPRLRTHGAAAARA